MCNLPAQNVSTADRNSQTVLSSTCHVRDERRDLLLLRPRTTLLSLSLQSLPSSSSDYRAGEKSALRAENQGQGYTERWGRISRKKKTTATMQSCSALNLQILSSVKPPSAPLLNSSPDLLLDRRRRRRSSLSPSISCKYDAQCLTDLSLRSFTCPIYVEEI